MFLRLPLSLFAVVLAGSAAIATDASAPAETTPEAVEFFERQVRPLLAAKCFACHSDATDEPKGGLRLDSLDAVLHGGDSGPAATAGDVDGSLLIEAVSYESGLDMPPSEPLSAAERKILEQWVRLGLPWTTAKTSAGGFDLQERISSHWAWQPRRITPPPEAPPRPTSSQPTSSQPEWAASAIDRFIRRGLDEAGLEPAERTSRPALLRRIYFDLIGLPPTPEQIARFAQDDRPDAFDRVVDRLLADPQFGVRWGRHWLDLVRYAETYGHEFDYPIPHAWKYRDWVVDSLNEDVPYDRFATEQLAGDLVADPRRDPIDQTNRSLLGTGFWWLGDAVHAPVDARDDHALRVENQIDVAGKTFLGLTIACARCHDHKFDAILQSDYYALGGLLQSTTRSLSPTDPGGRTTAAIDKVRRVAAELQAAVLAEQKLPPPPNQPPSSRSPAMLFDFSARSATGATTSGWAFDRRSQADWAVTVRTAPAEPLAGTAEPTGPAEQAAGSRVVVEPASWVDSSRLGRAAVGVWRSPPFEITGDTLAYRVIGEGEAEVRLVVEGYFMNDYHQLLFGGIRFKPPSGSQWRWHIQSGDLRHYIGHTAHIELVDQGDGFVGLSHVQWLGEGEHPSADEGRMSQLRSLSREELSPHAAERLDAFLDASSNIPAPTPVLAAAPLPPRDIPLALRGDAGAPGERIPRGDLTALVSTLSSTATSVDRGAGDRLELARNWTSAENPLFARVAVNRLWHHLTGRGLVASCDNFGVLGDAPSHPELLDYLVEDFVAGGWSSKRSIRAIVRTQTYAMRSEPRSEALAVDPTNRLLHTARVRRLEGEVIRDAALQLAGLLDRRLGGPSVPIHLSEEMTGRGRPAESGPLDGDGRRSLYIAVRRNFLSPTMLAFDTPMPATTAGRRNVSNVPAQALVMLNHPLFHEASAAWAERVVPPGGSSDSEGRAESSLQTPSPLVPRDPPGGRVTVEPEPSLAQRVTRMYREAFGRDPSATELETAIGFLTSVDAADRPAAWQELAHVLFNVKEFIFLP
ncbi:PSD1 and planctomycete cytochrome C domain-containing protein [Candidatus Laterigemmans baculatus]|nr:PSD1 and planctomycete cytochrome C domain-containing protein [Candidatus Laterigemmans baculatus]